LCDSANPSLGSYYIRWTGGNDPLGEEWDDAPFDPNGVLLTPPLPFYHATRIAQYGLELHARWLESGSVQARDAFLSQANWLRDNQRTCAGIRGCYPHPLPWTVYGANAGFLSAMTQGEAISVLLRAYESTKDERFFCAAHTASGPFRSTVEQGGVVCVAGNDVYLEEAAVTPPAHILNGWIYALFGLYELSTRGGEPALRDLFERSVQTLRRRLPLYDSGRWSYYSLLATRSGFRKLATLKYHAFHIAQLHVLASMTGDALFRATAERWETYANSATSKVCVWANAAAALLPHFVTHSDTVPGGARSIV
jgi:hypothetical protein